MSGLDPDTALDQVETSPGGRCGTAHLEHWWTAVSTSGGA
jgi:hypothetical protein